MADVGDQVDPTFLRVIGNAATGLNSITFVSNYNPYEGGSGYVDEWYTYLNASGFSGETFSCQFRLVVYDYLGASPHTMSLRSTSAWHTFSDTTDVWRGGTDSVYVVTGDIIGIQVQNFTTTSTSQYDEILLGVTSTSGYTKFEDNSFFTSGDADDWDDVSPGNWKVYANITPSSGGGGTPVDTCRDISGVYNIADSFDTYWGLTGGYVADIGPSSALINLQMPWGDDLRNDLVFTYTVARTFDNPLDSDEHYRFTLDQFSSTSVYDLNECWWKESTYNNKYVKTTGSDTNFGNAWDTAFKTIGKGFQEVGAGGVLFAEEGLYGGETLSNLNPPQTMSMNIQPSGHTEAQCNVWVNSTDSFTSGTLNGGTDRSYSPNGFTVIDPFQTIGYNGTIHSFSFNSFGLATFDVKLKIVRDDGAYYTFVGESDLYSIPSAGVWSHYLKCNIDVLAGDIIGIYIGSGTNYYLMVSKTGTDELKRLGTDMYGSWLKTSWNDTGANYLSPMFVGVECFKTT